MLAIVVALLFALLLAGAVLVYVAFPYRGEETPYYPQVGEAMRRGVDSLPTLDVRELEDARTHR